MLVLLTIGIAIIGEEGDFPFGPAMPPVVTSTTHNLLPYPTLCGCNPTLPFMTLPLLTSPALPTTYHDPLDSPSLPLGQLPACRPSLLWLDY